MVKCDEENTFIHNRRHDSPQKKVTTASNRKWMQTRLLSYMGDLANRYDITCRELLSLDSSNIQAEEWRKIARNIFENLEQYDGIVVTHGTDTMAYTASMLSFMLQNLKVPVVLTGSQMPIDNMLTDARNNLYAAFAAIDAGIAGVSVAYNRRIMLGCRAVKVRTLGFEAFESVNAPYLAEAFANGMRRYHEPEKPVPGSPSRYRCFLPQKDIIRLS